ncbi:MAG: antibiotic biosynthesis monooxygenase [Cyanobacteria bacterium P01_D01_bin.105]
MILEVAILDVIPAEVESFEADFSTAQAIIAAMPGYIHHSLKRCIEKPSRYILLVQWQTLEDHIEGFHKSADYQQWKSLLHHYYKPFPTVEHYEDI